MAEDNWVGGYDLRVVAPEYGTPYRDSKHGYIMANLNGHPRRVHRILWEKLVGKIPDGMQIDHINGDRTDNRLENLRLATNQQNSSNREVGPLTNIDIRCGNFRVKICHHGKSLYFGTYPDLELAQLVRDEARHSLNGEFNGR